MSRLRPLLLFLDDLHWADASTVDLLAYIGSKCAALRLLLVLTYRPTDLLLSKHPFVPVKQDLQARGVCREIALELLTRHDIERYLALEFPQHRFPEELAALIHAKTEGNPLFMVDLLRHLRDRQVLAQEQGRWVLAQSLPDLERELPESVRSMIERKIAQLGEEDRRLLVAASVQGSEFEAAVVARALALDAADVEEQLERLERVHAFVRLVGEHEFPDRTLTLRYRFVHLRGTWQSADDGSVGVLLSRLFGRQVESEPRPPRAWSARRSRCLSRAIAWASGMAPRSPSIAVAVGDGLVLGLLGADDEHDRDLLELGVADLGADLLGPVVERGPEAGRHAAGSRTRCGVVGDLVGDRQHADLLRGQPEREGAGEVLDQDAHEPLHAAERGAVDHHRAVRLVVRRRCIRGRTARAGRSRAARCRAATRGRCSRGR